MHNTLFYIVAHLVGSALLIRSKLLPLFLYVRQLLFVNVIVDIKIS